MPVFEDIKRLFKSVPDETKSVLSGADTPDEVVAKLDKLYSKNEMKLQELIRNIENLEANREREEARIKTEDLTGFQKETVLLNIKRLRKQIEICQSRVHIYDRNMNLHLSLIGKITDIQAVEMRGVDEEHIDKIVVSFEENMEKYTETMFSGEAIDMEGDSVSSSSEAKKLRDLEKEILGEEANEEARTSGKKRRPPVKEALSGKTSSNKPQKPVVLE